MFILIVHWQTVYNILEYGSSQVLAADNIVSQETVVKITKRLFKVLYFIQYVYVFCIWECSDNTYYITDLQVIDLAIILNFHYQFFFLICIILSNIGSEMIQVMNSLVYKQIFQTQSISQLCFKLQTQEAVSISADSNKVKINIVI